MYDKKEHLSSSSNNGGGDNARRSGIGYWWSSSGDGHSDDNAVAGVMAYNGKHLSTPGINKNSGLSVRCVLGTDPVFTVSSAQEFAKAIGSDRVIQLKAAAINLTGVVENIIDVNNLKIIGLGNQPVKIFTSNQDNSVIHFYNCKNITIENVNAGHEPKAESCEGAVFSIYNSENFTINKSIMYGSGTHAIIASNVNGLKCNNSVMKECTYAIMHLTNVRNFEFNNLEAYDNAAGHGGFIGIYGSNSNNITFKNSKFHNNDGSGSGYYNPFVSVTGSNTIVHFNDCQFRNNKAKSFANKESAIRTSNLKLTDNDFKNGIYSE